MENRVRDYMAHHPALKVLTAQEREVLRQGYADGYQDAMLDLMDQLAAWMEHAERGARDGAHLYHQGRIALILDIQEWAKNAIEDYEQCKNTR